MWPFAPFFTCSAEYINPLGMYIELCPLWEQGLPGASCFFPRSSLPHWFDQSRDASSQPLAHPGLTQPMAFPKINFSIKHFFSIIIKIQIESVNSRFQVKFLVRNHVRGSRLPQTQTFIRSLGSSKLPPHFWEVTIGKGKRSGLAPTVSFKFTPMMADFYCAFRIYLIRGIAVNSFSYSFIASLCKIQTIFAVMFVQIAMRLKSHYFWSVFGVEWF